MSQIQRVCLLLSAADRLQQADVRWDPSLTHGQKIAVKLAGRQLLGRLGGLVGDLSEEQEIEQPLNTIELSLRELWGAVIAPANMYMPGVVVADEDIPF